MKLARKMLLFCVIITCFLISIPITVKGYLDIGGGGGGGNYYATSYSIDLGNGVDGTLANTRYPNDNKYLAIQCAYVWRIEEGLFGGSYLEYSYFAQVTFEFPNKNVISLAITIGPANPYSDEAIYRIWVKPVGGEKTCYIHQGSGFIYLDFGTSVKVDYVQVDLGHNWIIVPPNFWLAVDYLSLHYV
jgi:hypothetical protein